MKRIVSIPHLDRAVYSLAGQDGKTLGGGQTYGRIFGGIGWPAAGGSAYHNPAALVVVAEHLHEDTDFGCKRLDVLEAATDLDGRPMADMAAVFAACRDVGRRLLVQRWLAPDGPYRLQLGDDNRRAAQLRQPRLRIDQPMGAEFGPEHLAGLVRKRTREEKTLTLGDERLAQAVQLFSSGGTHGSFSTGVGATRWEDNPLATALFCAVAGMDMEREHERAARRGRGVADARAGY